MGNSDNSEPKDIYEAKEILEGVMELHRIHGTMMEPLASCPGNSHNLH